MSDIGSESFETDIYSYNNEIINKWVMYVIEFVHAYGNVSKIRNRLPDDFTLPEPGKMTINLYLKYNLNDIVLLKTCEVDIPYDRDYNNLFLGSVPILLNDDILWYNWNGRITKFYNV